MVPVFWYGFSAPISRTCVLGITIVICAAISPVLLAPDRNDFTWLLTHFNLLTYDFTYFTLLTYLRTYLLIYCVIVFLFKDVTSYSDVDKVYVS